MLWTTEYMYYIYYSVKCVCYIDYLSKACDNQVRPHGYVNYLVTCDCYTDYLVLPISYIVMAYHYLVPIKGTCLPCNSCYVVHCSTI